MARKNLTGADRETSLVNAAMNSSSTTTLKSCNGGLNARIDHPITFKTVSYPTNSEAFAAAIAELVALGMGDYLATEMADLATALNLPIWNEIAGRVLATDEATEEEAA